MISTQPIVIYGAGGFAREVAWLVESSSTPSTSYTIECFIDDNEQNRGQMLNNIPIISLCEAYSKYPVAKFVVAIGNPKTRRVLAHKALEEGFEPLTLVHPKTEMSRWITMGEGVVICAGTILTTNITIGSYVQINLGCTIGHDAVLGDYTTLAPGVHISGQVIIGNNVYVGTGAVIINGTSSHPLIIGDDVTIGAAACVTKSVPARQTVVGIPAKSLNKSK